MREIGIRYFDACLLVLVLRLRRLRRRGRPWRQTVVRSIDRRGADVTIPCKVMTRSEKVISLNITFINKKNYSRVLTQIKKLPGD